MRSKKLLIENPSIIIDKIYYSQKSSTFLVGIIWTFMVFMSFIGNIWIDNLSNTSLLKSSLYESVWTPKIEQNNISNITIGKQTIIIWWKEYTLEITPKF